MIFRDDYERKAHDIICHIKYGSVGGLVQAKDVQHIGDILRGKSFRPAVTVPEVCKVFSVKVPPPVQPFVIPPTIPKVPIP